jgi:hypothetical protein
MKKNKLTTIEWYDACSKEATDEEIEAIKKSLSGKELLVINKTYGKVIASLKDVVVVMTEDSTSEKKDITIIPKGWIIK